ncbi:MAG TPA: methyltransferase domain-containing protein [Candidatus Krumholzibacteriaceae bacterium]
MAQHVCPWWVGYFLASPMRRFAHNPRKILAPYIRPGMTVMDLGPGMATFTLDLARFAGPTGKVIAVDIQARMLEQVKKRAAKAGLLDRIDTLLAGDDGAWARGLAGRVDFALAFYMVHEVPDATAFLTLVRATLALGGRLLVVEPKMHVSARAYAGTVDAAQKAGFRIIDSPKIRQSRTMLLA